MHRHKYYFKKDKRGTDDSQNYIAKDGKVLSIDG
jgi:hypothetical protein